MTNQSVFNSGVCTCILGAFKPICDQINNQLTRGYCLFLTGIAETHCILCPHHHFILAGRFEAFQSREEGPLFDHHCIWFKDRGVTIINLKASDGAAPVISALPRDMYGGVGRVVDIHICRCTRS